MSYPMDAKSRQKLRHDALARLIARAHRQAAVNGTSIKCGEYNNHAPLGCQNDGSGCLCSCHDPGGPTP